MICCNYKITAKQQYLNRPLYKKYMANKAYSQFKNKIISFLITLSILSLLVLLGPVEAISLNLSSNASNIQKGKTIEFTADKQGTFTVFCSVFCGSGHSGMKGKIIIK